MKPKVPEKFFVIERKHHSILKWDKVTQDINGNPVTIQKYEIYRTSKTNGYGYDLLFEVLTTDSSGDVDTCFVDVEIDDGIVYFYKISVVNTLSEESDLTPEKTDYYFGDIQDKKVEVADEIVGRYDVSLFDTVIYG